MAKYFIVTGWENLNLAVQMSIAKNLFWCKGLEHPLALKMITNKQIFNPSNVGSLNRNKKNIPLKIANTSMKLCDAMFDHHQFH